MRFSDFKMLPVPLQAHLICSRGVLISERSEADMIVALYAVDLFYVEVYYRAADSEVLKILSFHEPHFLEPYLGQIQLPELFPAPVFS